MQKHGPGNAGANWSTRISAYFQLLALIAFQDIGNLFTQISYPG